MQTLDRDIRLSLEQIAYVAKAVRQRRHQLGRSIAAAEANHRAGARIQHGTHERNIAELAELSQVQEALEVARRQIQRQIVARLEARDTTGGDK